MTDSTTVPAVATPKPKTVAEDMASRTIFANTTDATAFLNRCLTDLSDFKTTPMAFAGQDSEGDFDPAIYTDGIEVMIAKLTESNKLKCIVIAPVPSLALLMDSAAGELWVQKIIYKELNHVAVRNLRTAADISTVIDQMPTTVTGYIESGRGDGGGIMESFNELYKIINTQIGAKSAVWLKARLIKSELKKCLESTAYAKDNYPSLESREGKPSLFVLALQFGQSLAKTKGFDTTIFDRWLETRDSKVFDSKAAEDDEEDIDVAAMTTAMLADEAKTTSETSVDPTQPTVTTEPQTQESETTTEPVSDTSGDNVAETDTTASKG